MSLEADMTQPHGAPGQKARVLHWLQTEPGGLTQLQALEHLAVQRLAAIVYRLKTDDGHPITTELVELPTRYGPAQVARYHLAHAVSAPAETEHHRSTDHPSAQAPASPGPRVDLEAMRRELFGDPRQ